MPGDIPTLPADLKDMPARGAHFCLNILRFMEKKLGLRLRGTKVLLAFSGGADSSALLLALHCLGRKAGFTLAAAHLDHMLRPSSASEADYCRRFCAQAGVECLVGRRDVGKLSPRSAGLEEKARAARYVFLAEKAEESGADFVALGHNNNDLAEDILMRLIRGAGWPGLAGMKAFDAGRSPEPSAEESAACFGDAERHSFALVRPLLYTPRADIEDFLKCSGIGCLHDESNADRHFFRNRVRLDIVPLLSAENPAFLRAVRALHMQGEVDREYFAAFAADFALASGSGKIFIERERLAALPKALRLRLYKKILDELGPGQVRFFSLSALDDPLPAGRGQAKHLFPGGKSALVGHKGILFRGAGPDMRLP
ncbi:MAG: tRNA lysidine(34) synthetase TilS [Desulfovibrio sp.]|jgi:tRNA(Ile)-lysidine synthase|nr:tRNA lysidine(34) synthetase TilS [Desulfovibrio sp.]